MEDIKGVVTLHSDAEKALPSSHPGHAVARSSLALCILQLCHHYPPSDRILHMTSEAFTLFESAAHHPTSPSHDQFLIAFR
jgi:hypothetical protein